MIGNQQSTKVAMRMWDTLATFASDDSLLACSRLVIAIVASCKSLKCSLSFFENHAVCNKDHEIGTEYEDNYLDEEVNLVNSERWVSFPKQRQQRDDNGHEPSGQQHFRKVFVYQKRRRERVTDGDESIKGDAAMVGQSR